MHPQWLLQHPAGAREPGPRVAGSGRARAAGRQHQPVRATAPVILPGTGTALHGAMSLGAPELCSRCHPMWPSLSPSPPAHVHAPTHALPPCPAAPQPPTWPTPPRNGRCTSMTWRSPSRCCVWPARTAGGRGGCACGQGLFQHTGWQVVLVRLGREGGGQGAPVGRAGQRIWAVRVR